MIETQLIEVANTIKQDEHENGNLRNEIDILNETIVELKDNNKIKISN